MRLFLYLWAYFKGFFLCSFFQNREYFLRNTNIFEIIFQPNFQPKLNEHKLLLFDHFCEKPVDPVIVLGDPARKRVLIDLVKRLTRRPSSAFHRVSIR